MLKSLIIKNYALIEDLQASFDSGFTVITGETGAGKSILLGALDLVMGRRADTKVMRIPEDKCIVEAHFDVTSYSLQGVFQELELDYDGTTILRREIWPSGKSRAFVNDSPVSLNQVQELKKFLIEIHHQGDTHNLESESFQLNLIDTIAGLEGSVKKYKADYDQWQKTQSKYEDLVLRRQKALQEEDYQKFVLEELNALNLDKLDQNDLEYSRNMAQNQEQIQQVVQEVSALIGQDDIGALDRLFAIRQRINSIAKVSDDFVQMSERIDGLRIELQDIQASLEDQLSSIDYQPEELLRMEQLLDELYRVQRKHGVQTTQELIELRDELSQGLQDTSALEESIEELGRTLIIMKNDLEKQATQLHENRLGVIPSLEARLSVYFNELALPEARLKFILERSVELNSNGGVHSSILFSANKGIDLRPIEKVASGGEMSRVTLSVKAVLAEYQNLPTLIFDEIDTGISGETALKMAEILSQMSARGQLFCLTHLPQTAAKGRFHKRIFKESTGEKTRTYIQDLEPQQRILEIAQMIGGHELTDSAKAHARQLLN